MPDYPHPVRRLKWAGYGLGLLLVVALLTVVLQRGPLAPDYAPLWYEFLDERRGTVVLETLGFCPLCSYRVERTDDGGRSWSVSLTERPPDAPPTTFDLPEDAGMLDEPRRGVIGWAETPKEVIVTSNGGHSWRSAGKPCERFAPGDANLSALDARRAWALCGQGVMVATADGGATWKRIAGRGLPRSRASLQPWSLSFGGPMFGLLPVGGDQQLLATHDGGSTWRPVRLPRPWVGSEAEAVSDRTAFVQGRARTEERILAALLATHDAGRTWNVVRRWSWDPGYEGS
jgi:hypothetical protein